MKNTGLRPVFLAAIAPQSQSAGQAPDDRSSFSQMPFPHDSVVSPRRVVWASRLDKTHPGFSDVVH